MLMARNASLASREGTCTLWRQTTLPDPMSPSTVNFTASFVIEILRHAAQVLRHDGRRVGVPREQAELGLGNLGSKSQGSGFKD